MLTSRTIPTTSRDCPDGSKGTKVLPGALRFRPTARLTGTSGTNSLPNFRLRKPASS